MVEPTSGPDDDQVITGVDRWRSVAFWSARGERNREYYYSNHYTVYDDDEPPTQCVYRCPDPVTRTTGQPAICSYNGTGAQSQPRYRVPRKNLLFYKIIIIITVLSFGIHSAPLLSKIVLSEHSPNIRWTFRKLLFDTFEQTRKNNTVNTVYCTY